MEQKISPLVSVVVPVYNVAPYIEACVQSLLEQTYNKIEIILVDDGSTDQTGAICDSFDAPQIQVIHKKNGGVSSARNAGLERAKGEYIVFVDSDDYVKPDYIQFLLETLLENDADIAVCGFVRTTKSKSETEKLPKTEGKISHQEKEKNNKSDINVISGKDALNQLYSPQRLYYIACWNKIYKANLFENIRYPEGMLHEDEAVIHQLYREVGRIALSKKPLYYYYMSDSSIMRGKYKAERMGILYMYLDRMKMFAEDKNAYMEENSCKQCMVAALMHYYLCRKEKDIPQEKADECLAIFHKCKSKMKNASYISWKYKLFFNVAAMCPYVAGKLVDIKCNRFYHGE